MKNGVSKKFLRTEYMEDCHQAGEEPLMYSQFCYYIQQDEDKCRATMHISRKPAEQVEVDWAGDTAGLVDPYTGEVGEAYIFVGVMTYSQYAYVEAFPDEKQQSSITAAGKTNASTPSIMKWQSTMGQRSFRPVSGLRKTNQMLREPWGISPHGSLLPCVTNSSLRLLS